MGGVGDALTGADDRRTAAILGRLGQSDGTTLTSLGLLARWAAVLAWMAFIFALSATPDLRVSPDQLVDLVLRKLGHMGVFGILALLIAWAWPWRRPLLAALLLATAYAASDEIHQLFVAGRTGDPLDVAIDVAGAAIALVGWSWASSRRAQRDSQRRLRPEVEPRKRRHSALAALLSLIWPGLGQAYRGQRRRAMLFAVPPLLLAVAIGSLALIMRPSSLIFHLIVPIYTAMAAVVVLFVVLWWILAVLDAGRPHSGRSAAASVAVLAVLLLGAGWAGNVLLSFYEAGQQIAAPISTPVPTVAPNPTLAPGSPLPTGAPTASPAAPTAAPQPTATPSGQERITILFLGADLGRGAAGQLTDSIQIASFDPRSGEIAMISVPRDTGQLPMSDGGRWDRKINELMTYAESHPDEYPEGGLATLMKELGYIIGVPIDYHATVDFIGFVQLIDAVGGVDVTLDRPIADPHIHVRPDLPRGFYMDPGDHHLDGPTALAYARSRKGPKNSDYQRARRQQQVLLALRHKVNDPRVLGNLPGIIDAAAQMVRTNAPLERVPQIISILQASTGAQAKTYVLRPTEFAEIIPRAEIGQVFMTRLKMDRVAALSIELFGEDSRYAQESE